MYIHKIIFVTYDWSPERTRLLPWRIVFEVSRNLINEGHAVVVLSVNVNCDRGSQPIYYESTVPVIIINHVDLHQTESSKVNELIGGNPDLIFFPITWRSALKSTKTWPIFNIPVIAYHGSGYYRKSDVFKALKYMSLKAVAPYAIDALIPIKMLISALRKRGVRGVICMSEFNRDLLTENGWPCEKIITIPPGIESDNVSIAPQFKDKLNQSCPGGYILFLGNATPIRGFETLIDAAQQLSDAQSSFRILCLIRSDPGNQRALHGRRLARKLENRALHNRVVIMRENFSPEEIRTAIIGANAVVMPFLLVPSEIPLGIIEAMKEGVPVITTCSGGTSGFVGNSSLLARPANAKNLAKQILELFSTDNSYLKKLIVERMHQHPSWKTVASMWLSFAEKCIKD